MTPSPMITDEAVEAALDAFYGPDWRLWGVPGLKDQMRRALATMPSAPSAAGSDDNAESGQPREAEDGS